MSLISEQRENRVAHLTLKRPEALNALNKPLIDALIAALERYDSDPEVGCIVLYGSDRAFAAGVDIKAMLLEDFASPQSRDMFIFSIKRIHALRTPIIAAVAGYALGGGCELAMACDFIIAAENAQFGQPEVKLGIIPGLGGTQRLTRAVGKAKAMDMILSGRNISALEAERAGLVARIVPEEALRTEATTAAETIANYSLPVVKMAKQAVNAALETPLQQGLLYERGLFESAFALEDRREGMTAFIEKRAAKFRHQ